MTMAGSIIIWQSTRCPGFWCGYLWGKDYISRVASGVSERAVLRELEDWRRNG